MREKQEKLLREFIRKTFVSNLLKEQREEHAIRSYVRSLISEVRNEQVLETFNMQGLNCDAPRGAGVQI